MANEIAFRPLLQRYAGRLLSTIAEENRRRIVDFLFQHPGSNFGAIQENLQLTNGNLGNHLKVLTSAGFIERVENYLTDTPARYSLSPVGRALFESLLENFVPEIESIRWKRTNTNLEFRKDKIRLELSIETPTVSGSVESVSFRTPPHRSMVVTA